MQFAVKILIFFVTVQLSLTYDAFHFFCGIRLVSMLFTGLINSVNVSCKAITIQGLLY